MLILATIFVLNVLVLSVAHVGTPTSLASIAIPSDILRLGVKVKLVPSKTAGTPMCRKKSNSSLLFAAVLPTLEFLWLSVSALPRNR